MGDFGPRERTMLAALLVAYPKPVAEEEFISLFYAGAEDGGALSAEEIVRHIACNLRKVVPWKVITKKRCIHLVMGKDDMPMMLSENEQTLYDIIKLYPGLRVSELAEKTAGEININSLAVFLIKLRKKLDEFGRERLTNAHHAYSIVKQRNGMGADE